MKDYNYIKTRFDEDGLEAPASLDADVLRRRLDAAGQSDAAGQDKNVSAAARQDKTVSAATEQSAGSREYGAYKYKGSSNTRPPGGWKKPKRRWLKPVAGLAACACIAFVLVPATASLITTPNYNYLSKDDNGLYTFKNSSQLDKTVKKIIENSDGPGVFYTGREDMDMAIVEDAEVAPADGMIANMAEEQSSTAGKTAQGAPGHSDTYTQVDGVDEADIVKTDGKYIYHVSDQENQVVITKVDGDRTRRVSAVGDEGDSMIRDIYVSGNQLIVISSSRTRLSGALQSGNTVESGAVSVYDITDRRAPKKTGRYAQTGSILSSRMTGGRIVLVTNESFYTYSKGGCVPAVSYDDSEAKPLDTGDLRCVPSPSSASYTTVGLIDTSKGILSQKTTRTGAVLGSSDQIYCNTTDLYITASEYDSLGRSFFPGFGEDNLPMNIEERTRIIRVGFGDGKVDYLATGIVDGRVNDQFSMDASKGNFKIATTSRRDGQDVNNLFILDQDLKEVGSLRNFARDEHIEAVRYIGDYAYVITYEQTDPLFIIDLSSPGSPVIKGHVKISGFSTLLVPVDSEHILGFGYSTESTEFGEATNGVKLALFDVSDPANPKVADSSEFPGLSSPIQYDHKALLVGPQSEYYAFPFSRYALPQGGTDVIIEDIDGFDTEDGADDEEELGNDAEDSTEEAADMSDAHGIKMFDARGGKLSPIKDLPSGTAINRCIYIGDYVYGICEDDSILAYKL